MQSAEEFAGRLRYREIEEQWDGENETYVDVGFGLSDQDAIEEVAARDAEIKRECAEKRNEGCDGCEWRLSRSACMACSRSFADRYKRAAITGEEE